MATSVSNEVKTTGNKYIYVWCYEVHKSNRKIGENLKLLLCGYRCQICGQVMGEKYDSHIANAYHVDYFVNSLNNDVNNQMIVCPNHYSIMHDMNPVFDLRSFLANERMSLKGMYE